MKKVRWGILSTAKIGREKVVPAMLQSELCEVTAMASPNKEKLEAAASSLGIKTTFATYEELLADPSIDAVYIPLPNHLHVKWAIKSLEANKHVLCEKPIGLSAAEAQTLIDASKKKPQLKIMEAFMYRFHPQWVYSKKIIREGKIGELRNVQSFFSYYNADFSNIRNRKDTGGGGLLDIGCYCISFARFLFEEEPLTVKGLIELDPQSGVDRLASGLLTFSSGTSSFTCSTQLMPYQRVNIIGTEGRIEIEIPVNIPGDKKARIWLHLKNGSEEILFDAVDQYTLQCDAFSRSIINNTAVPTPLQDALDNMRVIEAIFRGVE